jgi:membrane-bound lytic murein transglycosylase D
MEKHVLNSALPAPTTSTRSGLGRTGAAWGWSLLGALLLSACGTPVGGYKSAASKLDMDTLLYTAPPGAGVPPAGFAPLPLTPRHLSTQDPTSGLRVDMGAAALTLPELNLMPLAPAPQAQLATAQPVVTASVAAATPQAPQAPLAPTAGEAATVTSTAPVNATAPKPSTTLAVASPGSETPGASVPEEAKEALGTVSDPLRPDAPIDLSDISANSDLWTRVRSGFGLPELDSALVADHERYYATRPEYVQRMTERASRYLFHVVDEIERRKMPSELALLPFIESAFNPQAMSSARASGIWQFMPATGKDFELKQNLFRDDRRDVLASTRAALDYLQKLNRQFGDWHLALAAYNWGEGNVQRAINRNIKLGLGTDYASLNMPPETRNYVPKLHAVKHIIGTPERFGLTLTPIENHPYFVSVPLQRDMDAPLAARLAGLPLDEFKALNPSLNKPVILAAGTPQVLLPYDNAGLFVHNLAQHKGPLATWTAWVVPRTMRPADAARQVGMSEASLKDVNHIPAKMLVKAGSTLLVPRTAHREDDVSEALADNAMMALAPDAPPLRKASIRAGKRDTVATLARKLKVSPIQLAQWNRMSSGASLKAGQTLVYYAPAKAASRSAMASTRGNSVKGQRVAVVAKASPSAIRRAVASRSGARGGATRIPAATRGGRVKVASAR